MVTDTAGDISALILSGDLDSDDDVGGDSDNEGDEKAKPVASSDGGASSAGGFVVGSPTRSGDGHQGQRVDDDDSASPGIVSITIPPPPRGQTSGAAASRTPNSASCSKNSGGVSTLKKEKHVMSQNQMTKKTDANGEINKICVITAGPQSEMYNTTPCAH